MYFTAKVGSCEGTLSFYSAKISSLNSAFDKFTLSPVTTFSWLLKRVTLQIIFFCRYFDKSISLSCLVDLGTQMSKTFENVSKDQIKSQPFPLF